MFHVRATALLLATVSPAAAQAQSCPAGGWCDREIAKAFKPTPQEGSGVTAENRFAVVASQPGPSSGPTSTPTPTPTDASNPIVSMSPHEHADMRGHPCPYSGWGATAPAPVPPR